MPLNHINLCSSDVDALAGTLAAHFDYRIADRGVIPTHNESDSSDSHFAVLVGTDGSELVITQIESPADGGSAYPDGFHFGTVQNSRDDVYAKHDELVRSGLSPRPINDGFEVWGATWTAFYCPLGDGLEIEVNYRTPSDQLDRPMAV